MSSSNVKSSLDAVILPEKFRLWVIRSVFEFCTMGLNSPLVVNQISYKGDSTIIDITLPAVIMSGLFINQ